MKTIMKKCVLMIALCFVLFVVGCGKKVELSFDTDGGNEISKVELDENATYELPTPTKEGYTFKGWYTNAEFTGDAVTSVSVANDMIVYAKWEKLAVITLDADGGTISQTTIYANVGENVMNLVSSIKPTKSGLTFGGWFVNDNELSSTAKLTANGITLKAKYKVEYTVNVYKQNLSLDGYDKEVLTDSAYVGKKVNANSDYEGFTQIEKDDTVTTITLDADKTKNVMNIYLDRDQYTITFRSNFPVEGMDAKTETITIVYGQEATLPEINYICEGYYLLGWAESVNGQLVYNAHYIDNLPVNGEKQEVKRDVITAPRTMSLYAVWNKGYIDMFGGNDYIFLTDNKETVYLARGENYFVGEFYEDDNSFIFYNDYENLEGKIFNDNTFAYYNVTRDEYSASLYEVGKGLNNDIKILFDAYNGIIYSKKLESGKTEESKGSYVIDENGYYIATFTEGELKDQTLTIVIGTVTVDNEKNDAFQVRNEEEVALGTLVRIALYQNQLTYYNTYYEIVLSGFGTLSFNTGSSISTYYYTYESDTKTLNIKNSSGQSMGVAKLMEINGKNGYVFYTESLDHEYIASNGDKLILDGLLTAKYIHGEDEISGYYTISSSAFGGNIVTFTNGGTVYTFLTSTSTETKVIGEGEDAKEETITNYSFETKLEGYAEYYYKNDQGTFYAPLIVINDTEEGIAKVYGYTNGKKYVLVLTGTFVYDETTKLYTFTTTNAITDTEASTTPLKIDAIKSFVCSLDTSATSYPISFWYSLTDESNSYTYEVKYTSTKGEKLSLVNGIAILAKDGYVVTGAYSTKDGLTTITNNSGSVYVEIDEDTKTFIVLDHAPYSAYIAQADGTVTQKLYVTFDGKGNATYVYYVTEEVGEGEEKTEQEVQKTIVGTVTKTENKTKQGYEIYQFTANEKTFKYLLVTTSQAAYVFPYNDNYHGEYTSNDGILYLDGFSYYASYIDKDGNELVGIYSISSENEVRIVVDSKYHYFDLDGKSFTARGTEFGTYIEMDNQGTPGNYISLDGYGKADIFKYNKTGEEYQKVVIDENATYTYDNEKFTISYIDGAINKTLVGYLSTYTYSSTTYHTFVVEHEEVVKTYLNKKDWSILTLDAIGNATKYNSKGIKETGTYMLITDSLLYYVNAAGTDANIFTYDNAKGTITESKFTARGYYTSDLKSLLFSQYGFAIFNNETRYYYCMKGNDVIIYRQDAENENANQYGFVEENFGEFDDIKDYKGETYYANDGYALTFTRVDSTKDDYPVLVTSNPDVYAPLTNLTFTPSGSATFSVKGTVNCNGTDYSCTVVREEAGDGYEMYILIGYYRFDITASYFGKDKDGKSKSTYEVTGLTYIQSFYPNTYLNTYYYIYALFGASLAGYYQNNLGMFYLYQTFNKDGTDAETYAKLDFYEGTAAKDLNGNSFSREKIEYSLENNIYKMVINSEDGYTYHIYMTLQKNSTFNMYAYVLYAITRVETLTYNNYQLTVERIIATDYNYDAGTLYSINLKKDDTELTYSEIFSNENGYCYVVKTIDEETKLITATTYYQLTFVSKNSESLSEDDTTLQPYESVTIEEKSAKTYYDADNKNYVDVVDGKIVLVSINGTKYVVKDCTYDETTQEYTFTLSSTMKYKVKITDNVITLTKIEEEVTE